MIKYFVLFLLICVILVNIVSPEMIKKVNPGKALIYFEKGLNATLYYLEKIDRIVFVPIKEKIIPGYTAPPPAEDPKRQAQDEDQEVQMEGADTELPPPVTMAKIQLKTGFIVEGELLNQADGDYTIKLDGFPVTFSADEIITVNISSE